MATRANVTTAIVGALGNRGHIRYVTTDVENFMKQGSKQVPACYVDIQTVEQEPVAYNHPTNPDRNATIDATITGWTRAATNTKVKAAVDKLYEEIHAAMELDSTLHGYINNVELQSSVTEPRGDGTEGSVTATYRIDYDYNHNSP